MRAREAERRATELAAWLNEEMHMLWRGEVFGSGNNCGYQAVSGRGWVMLRTKFPGRPWHILTPIQFVIGEGRTKRAALSELRRRIGVLGKQLACMLVATSKGGAH